MKIMLKQVITIILAISIFSIPFIFASCKDEKKSSVNFHFNPDSIPTMRTTYDTMLISDSGIIRYKVIAKTWEIYDAAKEPFSYFPDGIYLEQYDSLFNVITVVKADTAWNFEKQSLWKLRGNVYARNIKGETFRSEELFWLQDRNKPKIYSTKLVQIDRPEKGVFVVKDFEANQQMTAWEASDVQPQTEFYFNESEEGGAENIE